MSVHALSNLAVQELSDESAAIHGGGICFQGFDGLNGTGVPSPVQCFSNTAPIGVIGSFSFTGSLAFTNNKIESFRLTDILPGRRYRVSLFDNANFTTLLGTFNVNSASNGSISNLPPALRNRIGSGRIERTA